MIATRSLNPASADDVRTVLQSRIIELEDALREAQKMRPAMLRQLGYVPEPVLEFCNMARRVAL